MATNPQYPPPRRPQPVEKAPKLSILNRRSRFPWPLLALIAAGAILAAIIVWLPRTPHAAPAPTAAQVPQQPTGSQVQLTDLKIEPAPTGGAFYLSGILHNHGNSAITGAQVQASFMDAGGTNLETQTRPIEAVQSPPTGEDLAKAPVQPNSSRMFRVYFDHPPLGWNKQMPELKVTEITGTTS